MTVWQYFYIVDGKVTDGAPPVGLGRRDTEASRYNAQILTPDAQWVRSDFLQRYHINGTNEDDYVETSEDEARRIIASWVSSGRLSHAPDEP
jgi:hypothetical protein